MSKRIQALISFVSSLAVFAIAWLLLEKLVGLGRENSVAAGAAISAIVYPFAVALLESKPQTESPAESTQSKLRRFVQHIPRWLPSVAIALLAIVFVSSQRGGESSSGGLCDNGNAIPSVQEDKDQEAPGHIAHWRFDGTAPSGSPDESSLRMHGGASCTSNAPDGITGSLRLDGKTGYANTSGPLVDTTNSFTVMAWAYAVGNADQWAAVVSQEGYAKISAFSLHYMKCPGSPSQDPYCPIEPGNYWGFTMHRSSDKEAVRAVSTTQHASLRSWVHLAGVYDADRREIRIYVNGVRLAKRVFTAPMDSDGSLSVGRSAWYTVSDYWPGSIADVRIWNRVLSDGEIEQLAS
ncbi:LamG domain-containing protein [Nonomuraea typhae]|uniref:LamG domain-containing protein n=1 Tax=Nonomuraea typhae TaxID=2603600 RepID=UPI0012F7E13A|nr:LamG domain-containing protein [Nonomuraea typhae]